MDSLNRGWMAEREQQSLDIDELEAAVYRSRTSTWPKDLMTTTSKDGEEMPWPPLFGGTVPIFAESWQGFSSKHRKTHA